MSKFQGLENVMRHLTPYEQKRMIRAATWRLRQQNLPANEEDCSSMELANKIFDTWNGSYVSERPDEVGIDDQDIDQCDEIGIHKALRPCD